GRRRRAPATVGPARPPRGTEPAAVWLSTQTEAFDERAVALDVGVAQVAEQAAALSDEEQQAAAAVVVVLVGLEVFGQVGDALGEQRDLDLRRAGVAFAGRVLGDDLL